MAKRSVFVPCSQKIGVKILDVEFTWYSGYALTQKQKSIESLHLNAKSQYSLNNILEISTKSTIEEGIELSAFNLKTRSIVNEHEFSVEIAFQSSKVFKNGGPYHDLMYLSSREAKKDLRLKESGPLIQFQFFQYRFPLSPPTFFYDWLYINTALKNKDKIQNITSYDGFTDIEFNPKKSINCQAYSVALLASLIHMNIDLNQLKDPFIFLEIAKPEYDNRWRKEDFVLKG